VKIHEDAIAYQVRMKANDMGHILVVDDDKSVRKAIRQVLEEADFIVKSAGNGKIALQMVLEDRPDLIILDIMMPDMDGVEVCRRIRANPYLAKIPIIFLTARGRAPDVVAGLDAGADDYLVKPLEVIELPARIRAILRRAPGNVLDPDAETLTVGNIELHIQGQTVKVNDTVVELTTLEHRLLYALMANAGHPVSVDTLLETVWEYPPGIGDPNLVRVHIANIRAKLSQAGVRQLQPIQNVRGKGYLFALS
jgi:DNA-binding response OmpR family regulator